MPQLGVEKRLARASPSQRRRQIQLEEKNLKRRSSNLVNRYQWAIRETKHTGQQQSSRRGRQWRRGEGGSIKKKYRKIQGTSTYGGFMRRTSKSCPRKSSLGVEVDSGYPRTIKQEEGTCVVGVKGFLHLPIQSGGCKFGKFGKVRQCGVPFGLTAYNFPLWTKKCQLR